MTAPRPTPLDPEAAPADSEAGSTLTLVRGSTFCLSGTDGDIGGATHGLFARDTRVLSGLRLTADGRPPAPLGIVERGPDAAVLLGRLAPPRGRHDSVVLVERRRTLGEALTEDLTLHNFSAEAASTDLEVHVGADFADLFAVKDGRAWGRRAAGIVEPLQPSGGEAVEPLLRLCPDPSSEDAHSVDHDEGAPARSWRRPAARGCGRAGSRGGSTCRRGARGGPGWSCGRCSGPRSTASPPPARRGPR